MLFRYIAALVLSCGASGLQTAAPHPTPSPENGMLQIHFINVGQGDAAILISPNGKTVLFDNGVWGHCDAPVEYLRSIGVRHIDYQIISHYHQDHIGCTSQVLSAVPLNTKSFDRGEEYPGRAFKQYVDAVGMEKRQTAHAGQELLLDEESGDPVTIKFVALNGNGVDTDNENDKSLVSVVSFEDFKAELGGDLSGFKTTNYEDIESGTSAAVGRVDVYKVHHHCSAYSSNEAWLSTLQPRIGIVSAGFGNTYEHPSAECLERLHNHGVQTYWTSKGGGAEPLDGMDFVVGTVIVEVERNTHRFSVRGGGPNSFIREYPVGASVARALRPSNPTLSSNGWTGHHLATWGAVLIPTLVFLYLFASDLKGHRLTERIADDILSRLRNSEWDVTRFEIRTLIRRSYGSPLLAALHPNITVDDVVEQCVTVLLEETSSSGGPQKAVHSKGAAEKLLSPEDPSNRPAPNEDISKEHSSSKDLIERMRQLHTDPNALVESKRPLASIVFARTALIVLVILVVIQAVPSFESGIVRILGQDSALEELVGAVVITIAGTGATWMKKKSIAKSDADRRSETSNPDPAESHSGRKFRL